MGYEVITMAASKGEKKKIILVFKRAPRQRGQLGCEMWSKGTKSHCQGGVKVYLWDRALNAPEKPVQIPLSKQTVIWSCWPQWKSLLEQLKLL